MADDDLLAERCINRAVLDLALSGWRFRDIGWLLGLDEIEARLAFAWAMHERAPPVALH